LVLAAAALLGFPRTVSWSAPLQQIYIYIYIYIYIGAGIPDPQFNILKYLIREMDVNTGTSPTSFRSAFRLATSGKETAVTVYDYFLRPTTFASILPDFPMVQKKRGGGSVVIQWVRRRFKENQRYPFKRDERQTANMMCESCNTSISFFGPSNVFHNQNQPAPMAQHPHSQMGCHQDRPGRGLLWTGEADCQHEFRYPPCVSNCLPSPRPGMVQGRRLQALVAACAEMTRPLHLGGRMNFNSKPNGSLLGYSPHGTG
jgi:hypothetical protein